MLKPNYHPAVIGERTRETESTYVHTNKKINKIKRKCVFHTHPVEPVAIGRLLKQPVNDLICRSTACGTSITESWQLVLYTVFVCQPGCPRNKKKGGKNNSCRFNRGAAWCEVAVARHFFINNYNNKRNIKYKRYVHDLHGPTHIINKCSNASFIDR